MIDIHSKHDNMNKNKIFCAIICINNHIISYVNCMLSYYTCDKVPIHHFECDKIEYYR